MQKNRILIIVVQYYLSEEVIRKKTKFLVKNLSEKYEIKFHIFDIKNCNSSYLDISGYSELLNIYKSEDGVILLNDTVFTKHPWGLISKRINTLIDLVLNIKIPTLCGVVNDNTGLKIVDENNALGSHLSTFLIIFNKIASHEILNLLKSLPHCDDLSIENWIKNSISRYPVLDVLLDIHLGSIKNPWSWLSENQHLKSNILKRKKITVIFEYILSSKIINSSGCILPINYDFKYKIYRFINYHMYKIRNL
jgi:hypothetical protein